MFIEETLGTICDRGNGKIQTGPFGSQLHEADYIDDGLPVIMPKDIVNGQIVNETVARISEEKSYELSRHKLKLGAIVMPRRGEINKRAFITEKEEGWLCGTGCIKVELKGEELFPKFFYYYLHQPSIVGWIEKKAIGTTMLNLNTSIIRNIPVKRPPIETQKRIAKILSAYDDLIENNLKRIRLLEESARLLYREWFVRLKFPNHEHTPLIDGLPEDWAKVSVSDLGEVITGKTPSTTVENNYGDDFPFVKTPDMHGNIFVVKTESSLTEQGANTQRNKYLPKGTIMVSCIGTVGVVSLASTVCQTNQQINSVIPKSKEYQFYSFFALQDLKPTMEAIGGGATMNNVNKSKFESLDVLLPGESMLKNFDEIVNPMFEQILNLLTQNQKLKQARDLLLPRLMSGEIAV